LSFNEQRVVGGSGFQFLKVTVHLTSTLVARVGYGPCGIVHSVPKIQLVDNSAELQLVDNTNDLQLVDDSRCNLSLSPRQPQLAFRSNPEVLMVCGAVVS
jgi:hypothetical protein